MRVVVVDDDDDGGDYFEVMTLKVDLKSMSTQPLWFKLPSLPPKISFQVGSVKIIQDLPLLDQISLRGGICCCLTRFLFGVGSLSFVLNDLI